MSHIWALFHPLTGPLGPLAFIVVALFVLSALCDKKGL